MNDNRKSVHRHLENRRSSLPHLHSGHADESRPPAVPERDPDLDQTQNQTRIGPGVIHVSPSGATVRNRSGFAAESVRTNIVSFHLVPQKVEARASRCCSDCAASSAPRPPGC